MSDEDLKILAGEIIDFCNGLEALAVKLRFQIEKMFGIAKVEPKPNTSEEAKFSWNPERIKWEKAQGSKGEFEKSEDLNNPEFKAMLKDLAQHNGKLTRDSYFYWVYKNGSVVGRKKRS